ncbi:thiamine pyrophosphate-dependent enzyme [Methanogenium organophilum]|uniref:Thiamine pyrophosphate-dependent enzyme n=1 Tax=Methanogenium organophilum TaxID=2199 RepID=A0A9X9S2P6_METOG|nr:thiamine pyrophosphate-dependent enzyme [Methanogenium organophilum]WAI00764.1 thiamine pyrophosphate-dependent enzyme [Methanogenium organophilum]
MTKGLITDAQNTWCPGCGNFAIQHALKDVILRLESEGVPRENIVLVVGIGCHAKMADYLNVNSLYALHGRAVSFATGICIARPDLFVICCVGDGDAYAEGIAHLLFAAKRNVNMTVLVHNNRVYGLTKGQVTPTSPLEYHGKSNPDSREGIALNPPELLLSVGCSYIARGYSRRQEELKGLIYDGIVHPGFSCIDILQICASFLDKTKEYDRQVYVPLDHNPEDFDAACRLVREYSYEDSGNIPLGVVFHEERDIFHVGTPFSRQRYTDKKGFILRFIEERK